MPQPNSPSPRPRHTHAPAHRTQPATDRTRYDRGRDLPRLIPLWPHEIEATDVIARSAIIRKLYAALRSERQRGVAGHWTYDLARHNQLVIAYRAELSALKARLPAPAGRRPHVLPEASPAS